MRQRSVCNSHFAKSCLDHSHFAKYALSYTPIKEKYEMRVISKSRLKDFWEMPAHTDAEGPLLAWYQHVSDKSVDWRNWADMKRDFATASAVGNCTVFNIAGNKYRLVARIIYRVHKIFILKIMGHLEYDKGTWKRECGCYSPAPKNAGRSRGTGS
jgi:mRNA interferase HigB